MAAPGGEKGALAEFMAHIRAKNERVKLKDAKAFARMQEGSQEVSVFFHGLSDSPGTIAEIAEFYEKNGSSVIANLQTGHGTAAGDLANVTLAMWREDVDIAIRAALEVSNGRPINLIGFSMGGALAIDAIQRHGRSKFKTLLLVAPLIGFKRDFQIRLTPLLGIFKSFVG